MSSEIVGVWALRSFYIERMDTGERFYSFGQDPRGVLMMHPNGRMCAIITPRDQVEPTSDAAIVETFGKLIAYSGRYRLEPPDKFVTEVDVAWLKPWVETDQARTYRIDGDKLELITATGRMPAIDGPVRAVLGWTREA